MKKISKLATGLLFLLTLIIPQALSQEPGSAILSLSAKLDEHGRLLQEGVSWYIYQAKTDRQGKYRLVTKHDKASPGVLLPAGNYLVTATYGQAYLTQKIEIRPHQKKQQTFVINAGGLSVTSSFPSPLKVRRSRVRLQVYSGDTDQFGNRSLILKNLPADKAIILNAGIYHIVSRYGDVNAIVKGDVTVESGKITKATLSHTATHATFKLVKQAGGEALPDTQWKLLSPIGEIIRTTVGAIPSFILKSGEYAIRASRDGTTFEKKFTLKPGQSSQIEVVAGEPE